MEDETRTDNIVDEIIERFKKLLRDLRGQLT
jgi:hypothetical protein